MRDAYLEPVAHEAAGIQAHMQGETHPHPSVCVQRRGRDQVGQHQLVLFDTGSGVGGLGNPATVIAGAPGHGLVGIWWCDHTEEGHQWADDGPDGYWRTHARIAGPFTVVAVDRLNPDGSTELGTARVETHLDDFEDAEEARRDAADLVEVARALDEIQGASD